MSKVSVLALAISALALAACGGAKSFQSQASAPTVSYSYQDGGDYDEVKDRADDYCDDEYGRDAVLLSRDMEGDRYEATFACQ